MLAAALLTSVAGCAGAPAPDTSRPGTAASDGVGSGPDGAVDPGSTGGDSGTDTGAAPGAPIRVPARVQDQGRPLAEVTAEIEAGVREQCGGGLCVTLRTEHRDADGVSSCTFIATEPAQRSMVDRGTTIVIVAGSAPCEDASQPTASGEASTSNASPEGATATDGTPDEAGSSP